MPGNVYLTGYECRVIIRALEATEAKFRTLGVEDFYDSLLAKIKKTFKAKRRYGQLVEGM